MASKEYYLKNRDNIIAKVKRYALKNKEKIKQYNKQYLKKNKKKKQLYWENYNKIHSKEKKEYNKQYNVTHREQIRNQKREYLSKVKHLPSFKKMRNNAEKRRRLNPTYLEKRREYDRNYIKTDKPKARRKKYNSIYATHKYKTNIKFKINTDALHKVSYYLKKGYINNVLEKQLGYGIHKLRKHLESKFKEGMSWENYGKWHLDHIKPRYLFNIKAYGDKEFKKCWALSNLQPLWSHENYRKGKKHG